MGIIYPSRVSVGESSKIRDKKKLVKAGSTLRFFFFFFLTLRTSSSLCDDAEKPFSKYIFFFQLKMYTILGLLTTTQNKSTTDSR